MKISHALKQGARILSNCEKPMKDSRVLMCKVLNCSLVQLILKENEFFQKENEFFQLIEKRANFTPLEYITNKVSFYSRDFIIEEGVLIPRSETEILVDKAFALIKNMNKPRIAEIGVGSGIVSIMLALLKEDAIITSTDINKKAIELAKENAKLFRVEKRISFIETSYLDGVIGDFDLLVSNPPYIANKYPLEKHVLKEPHNALFGGEQGDEILQNIIKLAKKRKIEKLVCEMGFDQKDMILKSLNEDENIEFYKDLSGFYRGFIILN